MSSNHKFVDMAGRTCGQMTVIRHLGGRKWLCRCECGTEKSADGDKLRSGHTRSCGCLMRKTTAARSTKHGLYGTPEYVVWGGMVARCTNPRHRHYYRYGGRGIEVCERWRDFANFLADMGARPTPKHTIDRLDGDRGYEPGNCAWVTWREQRLNRNDAIMVDMDGETKSLVEWCETLGKNYFTVNHRIKRGWDPATALAS